MLYRIPLASAPFFVAEICQFFLLCAVEHNRKNWVLIDSVNGAKASAIVYSVVETARQNGLNCYRYFEHLLTELPKLADENGTIDPGRLDPLLPWSDKLPELCRAPRR